MVTKSLEIIIPIINAPTPHQTMFRIKAQDQLVINAEVIKLLTMPVKIDRVIRSKRRTISLQVLENGNLVVRAPGRVSLAVIQGFVESKKKWILKQKHQAETRRTRPHQFSEGELFQFLGRSFPLVLVDHQKEILLFNEAFHLQRNDVPDARQIFTYWYQQQALDIFSERILIYASKMALPFPTMRLSTARTRWGSCSPSGRISLTWRLVMAPMEVIDYVIIHELVHLKIKNHSKTFWEIVARYDSAYTLHRNWLRRFGYRLSL